jgi:hypothetical protein
MQQDQVRAGIAELEQEARNLLAADSIPFASKTSHPPAPLFTEPELARA